jgi:molybdopterin-containing oxidoreductase family iron-sulfur binding subunit
MNRLYVVEPTPTVTGTKADHRLPLKARDIQTFASALASAVGAGGGGAAAAGDQATWIQAIGADLQAHKGKSVVVAGDRQPAAVHALARAMNDALGNTGVTVDYIAPWTASPADGCASIRDLVADMNAGKVDVLLMLDGNPVFTAPADLNFVAALDKVATRVHFGLYFDETAEHCHWHIPAAHYLESWGDARAFDGTVSLIQPLIAPIYDGRQAIEILAVLNGVTGQTPVDLVKAYWKNAFDGKTKTSFTLRDSQGKPFANADTFWRHALHDGFLSGTTGTPVRGYAGTTGTAGTAGTAAVPASGLEIVFRPDPTILDGRFANNGWLQELPKPLCKVTWDNVAYVSPRTAETHGLGRGTIIEVKLQGRSAKIPVWVQPGTADDVVVVHFGYGRTKAGRVGNGTGHDVFGIRPSTSPWFASGAEVTKTGESYVLAASQNHFAMEERNPVRVVDLEEYRNDPKSVAKIGPNRPPKTLTLYPYTAQDYKYDGYKWGMSIDLNTCTGCSACLIGCVAENNIPVVGKSQVANSREMHWIRVDTYFEGSLDNPEVFNQPVPCQQCENAPCELVCPVAATTHNDEGLNDMVYNRCVGTRYCSNNCPYKVRRFNFLLYQDFTTPELQAARNPDVTVRSRGVMEKCTYCVQRISHARIDAKTRGTPIKDGEIKTACQQACPADAITFGNLNDPESEIAKKVKEDRNYGLLEDLGTRPRTTYLAVVRNPNPALEKKNG